MLCRVSNDASYGLDQGSDVTSAEAVDVYPGHYPDRCPPESASRSDMIAYRLVDGAITTEADFLSHPELVTLGLRRPPSRPYQDDCIASGLSVLDSQEAAARKRLAAGPMRKKRIAAGSINHSGLVLQTSGDLAHHTWWRPSNDVEWQNFKVVD